MYISDKCIAKLNIFYLFTDFFQEIMEKLGMTGCLGVFKKEFSAYFDRN